MKSLFDFTNIYSLKKTLRFELEPVGKTQEHIKSKGIIKCDTKLAESYKKMKQTIDKYHRDFIEISLEKAKLTGLEEFYRLYTADTETKKSNTYKKQFSAVKQSLRKEIVKCFKSVTIQTALHIKKNFYYCRTFLELVVLYSI